MKPHLHMGHAFAGLFLSAALLATAQAPPQLPAPSPSTLQLPGPPVTADDARPPAPMTARRRRGHLPCSRVWGVTASLWHRTRDAAVRTGDGSACVSPRQYDEWDLDDLVCSRVAILLNVGHVLEPFLHHSALQTREAYIGCFGARVPQRLQSRRHDAGSGACDAQKWKRTIGNGGDVARIAAGGALGDRERSVGGRIHNTTKRPAAHVCSGYVSISGNM